MSPNYLIVKSLDPPESVTDALDFANDEDFKAGAYQDLAGTLLTGVVWAGEQGSSELAGCPVSLEPTDAGLFLQFLQTDVPVEVVRSLVVAAWGVGAVVASTDSAEIVTGR